MTSKETDKYRTQEETEQRLRKMLSGAFSGPPTQLKDMPKLRGDKRSIAKSRSKTGSKKR